MAPALADHWYFHGDAPSETCSSATPPQTGPRDGALLAQPERSPKTLRDEPSAPSAASAQAIGTSPILHVARAALLRADDDGGEPQTSPMFGLVGAAPALEVTVPTTTSLGGGGAGLLAAAPFILYPALVAAVGAAGYYSYQLYDARKGLAEAKRQGIQVEEQLSHEIERLYANGIITDEERLLFRATGSVPGITEPGTRIGRSDDSPQKSPDTRPAREDEEILMDLDRVIDMDDAPATSRKTAAGFPRNARWFWKTFKKGWPEVLSPENKAFISKGLSPLVDPTWIQFYEGHAIFEGDRLCHHHVEQGPMAVPVPCSAHEIFDPELHEFIPD